MSDIQVMSPLKVEGYIAKYVLPIRKSVLTLSGEKIGEMEGRLRELIFREDDDKNREDIERILVLLWYAGKCGGQLKESRWSNNEIRISIWFLSIKDIEALEELLNLHYK